MIEETKSFVSANAIEGVDDEGATFAVHLTVAKKEESVDTLERNGMLFGLHLKRGRASRSFLTGLASVLKEYYTDE